MNCKVNTRSLINGNGRSFGKIMNRRMSIFERIFVVNLGLLSEKNDQ